MAAVEQVAHVPPGRADRDGGGPDPLGDPAPVRRDGRRSGGGHGPVVTIASPCTGQYQQARPSSPGSRTTVSAQAGVVAVMTCRPRASSR